MSSSSTATATIIMMNKLLLLVALFSTFVAVVQAFSITPRLVTRASIKLPSTTTTSTSTTSSLAAAGGGMGMGGGMASTKSKKKKKGGGGGGNNKSKEKRTPFDAAASMIKSEKLYDELMAESTKALMNNNNDDDAYYDDGLMVVTTEYIITARAKKTNGSNNSERQQSSSSAASSFVGANDWVPVAQMCLVRSITQDDNNTNNNNNNNDHEAIMESTLQAAISYYCREINYAACQSAPSAFQSLPRNNVEYGVEPIDSFMRYVYEDVIEGKKGGGNGESGSTTANGNATGGSSSSSMSKAQAREILELEAGVTDTALIKTAYKKQSFKYHPDRVSEEDRASSSDKFGLIKRAYDTLNSGIRNNDKQSWYESLGGRERNEFMGPITLLSMDKASALCNKAFRSAVVGIDPDLTMAFVARNQAAARL
jgi:hypothetical protein